MNFDATKNALDITTHIVAVAVEDERANDRKTRAKRKKREFSFFPSALFAEDDTERRGARACIKNNDVRVVYADADAGRRIVDDERTRDADTRANRTRWFEGNYFASIGRCARDVERGDGRGARANDGASWLGVKTGSSFSVVDGCQSRWGKKSGVGRRANG